MIMVIYNLFRITQKILFEGAKKKRKTLSLILALCLVFSLFTWCGLVSTADDLAPPGSESSIDREPDMRYQQTCYKVVCGVTNPYIKVLLIDLPISPDNNWDHVEILLNTATDGVLKNDTTLIRKVIIHELGHALKLAHPKGVNFLQDITNGRGSYTNDNCVCAVMNQGSPEDEYGLTCSTPKWHDKINLINKWGE